MKRILLKLLSFSLLILLIGQSSCRRMIDVPVQPSVLNFQRGTGALPLDPVEYAKIPLIQEPLNGGRLGASDNLFNGFRSPESIGMPPVGDQGQLNSCAGWAVGYATRSYLYRRATNVVFTDAMGQRDDNHVFSPSFIWNSLKPSGSNDGITINSAIDFVLRQGVCTLTEMPHSINLANYNHTLPSPAQKQSATNYTIKDWGRINIDKETFKRFLSKNNPVILRISTDDNFHLNNKQPNVPDKLAPDYIWKSFGNPTGPGGKHGSHAVVLTDYDNSRKAFRVQNSWNTIWGDNGKIWMHEDMVTSQVVHEAYVMGPGDKDATPAIVQTNPYGSAPNQQVVLKGSIESEGGKAITRYGFIVGEDSTVLYHGSGGIFRELNPAQVSFTTVPYSFSVNHTPVQNRNNFYRAYAATYGDYHYGKVIRITEPVPTPTDIPDEVEDSPTAVSTADPHLTTFDRGRYSFMGVGEFVAAKSTGDNFLVQVRQSPYPNSTQVSVNTGVAVQTGSDVVCVYAPNQLYVNRQAVPLTFTDHALANGGSLRYQRNRLTIKNANGDVVEVQLLGADLDYFITPAKNRKGKLSGILGNYDGNPQNDIAKADGQVLRNDYSALYPAFADSWRIKDTESLFFYDAGKNTNSYTDKAFPRSEVQLTAAQSAAAEQICRQAGVTDPAALQGCIVDVALTGNRGFADRAKENEVVSGAKTTLSVSNFAQYRNEFVLGSGGTINGNTAVLPSKGTIRWSDAYLNRDGYETEVVLAVNAPSPCFPLFDLEVVDLQNAGLQNFLRLSTNSGRTQVELVNSGVQPQFHPVNVFDGNRHRIKVNTYKIAAGVNTILQLEVRIDNYEPLLIRNVYATASLAGYLYPTLKSETLNCTTGQTTIYGWSFRSR